MTNNIVVGPRFAYMVAIPNLTPSHRKVFVQPHTIHGVTNSKERTHLDQWTPAAGHLQLTS